jgi:hypothetical protein
VNISHHLFVIPAKAGIHGLSYRVTERSVFKLSDPAMDSRFRGNDTVIFCEVG